MKDRNDRVRWFQIRSTCTDSIADDPVYLTVFIDATGRHRAEGNAKAADRAESGPTGRAHGGRARKPSQVRFPVSDEPRYSNADERGSGHDQDRQKVRKTTRNG